MRNAEELPSETIDNFYKQIGNNVKKQRKLKGYTQLQLAQALGHKSVGLVSQAEIYLKKQHFNIEHLYKIAYILECKLCDLFADTEDTTTQEYM
ncbi:helix-turn-helix domain-containing protein [Sulfurimonas indica]|uniref:helix-turn-helix domain-containing protein n=1 Tax=Sulfurimonas indica TaxID=2508707 RepID=UPI00165FF218|nr:helix-turn-helix transcriptional regulator [Sulfurimonas indica]